MFDIDSIGTSLFITIILVAVGFLALRNFNSITNAILNRNNNELEEDDDDLNSVLGEIFYHYNHSSEKEWLKWINRQQNNIKHKAALLLCTHLDSPPKQWGLATIEAIECLRHFKIFGVDKKLSEFIKKTSKIWQEYKSVPNYYEKAISVLAEINPNLALNSFSVEFEKNIESQSITEKKKILLAHMPALGGIAKDLLINILTNHNENFIIKSQALRTCLKLDKTIKNEIFLEALKRLVRKKNSLGRGVRAEEIHFIQDLIRESVMLISNKNFFDILQEACQSFQLQRIILDSLIAYFNSEFSKPSDLDYYAASLLKDSTHNDLKMYLANKAELTENEMENLIFKPILFNINADSLRSKTLDLHQLPIPEFLQEKYDEFKTAFFKNIKDHEIVTSEKIFGGVLATGDSEIKKLYFAQAIAKEKKWNFGYIDMSKITSRESYSENVSIFTKLRKPYLLYIKQPELFYVKANNDENSFREKFAQSLAIQSLDSKSFLIGDINCKIENTSHTNLNEAIKFLKYKYFPQSIEINEEYGSQKYSVVMKFLQSIEPYRIENHVDFCEKLSKFGAELNDLEFTFLTMRILSSMLLVFGKIVPFEEFQRLENKFKMIHNEESPHKYNNEHEKNLDIDADEATVTTDPDQGFTNANQAEQMQVHPVPPGSLQ